MRIGILGCGNIGTQLAQFADSQQGVSQIILFDKVESSSEALNGRIKKGRIVASLFELITKSDMVVECAHPEVVEEAVERSLDNKKPIMVMSVAGLLGKEYLFDIARRDKTALYVPSGAIAGIDAIKALSLDTITSVELVTTKHPSSFRDVSYIAENKMDLSSIDGKTLLFEGSAADAGRNFPQNMNVAATIYLASRFKDVKVKVFADPSIKTNRHEIRVQSHDGALYIQVDNVPSKTNKKTSQLAVLSAITRLKQILDSVHVGT